MAANNVTFTAGTGTVTTLSPDQIAWLYWRGIHGQDAGYYFQAPLHYEEMTQDWEDEPKDWTKTDVMTSAQAVIMPNDDNTFKVYLVVDMARYGSATVDQIKNKGQDRKPVCYVNGSLKSATSALDDYLIMKNPVNQEDRSTNADMAFVNVYLLGTFPYNSTPSPQTFTIKLAEAGVAYYSIYDSTIPTIPANSIPYSITITLAPVIKPPVITEYAVNPLIVFYGETGDATLYFTCSAAGFTAQAMIAGQLVGNKITLVKGNNSLKIPKASIASRTPIGESSVEVDLNLAPANITLTGNEGYMPNPGSDPTFKIPTFSPYAAGVPSSFTYQDSATSFSYYLPVQVESKYGTLTGKKYCYVSIDVNPEDYTRYELQLTVANNNTGIFVDKDYYTFYAYINNSKVNASVGRNTVTISMGRHKFNDLADCGNSVRGRFTLALGCFYATKSSPTKPDEVRGDSVLVTMTPILSIPLLTWKQSVTPLQMNTLNPGSINVTCDDVTPEDSAYSYAPTISYDLHGAITATAQTLNGDFSIAIASLPNSLEEYAEKIYVNSSPLRYELRFNKVAYDFKKLGGSAAAIQNTWRVYTPSGWTTYANVGNYKQDVILQVNFDVNNGPRFVTKSIVKASDHPHTELLLVGRQDSLALTYTWETDASWIKDTGCTLVFGDQVQAGLLQSGGKAGPYSVLPYTEGKAFKVYGYLTDTLGRHGPQVEIAVSDGSTTLANLYAYGYSNPKATMEAFRANSQGNVDEENGTYAKATYHWNYTQLRNYGSTVKIELIRDVDNVVVSTKTANLTNYAGATTVTFSGLSLDNSYRIVYTLTDSIGVEATYQVFIASGKVFMDFKAGGLGMGIGMRAENDNQLDIGWGTVVHGNLNIMGTLMINGQPLLDGNNLKY